MQSNNQIFHLYNISIDENVHQSNASMQYFFPSNYERVVLLFFLLTRVATPTATAAPTVKPPPTSEARWNDTHDHECWV